MGNNFVDGKFYCALSKYFLYHYVFFFYNSTHASMVTTSPFPKHLEGHWVLKQGKQVKVDSTGKSDRLGQGSVLLGQ